MMKILTTILLALAMTMSASAQQKITKSDALGEPAIRLRSCRMGTPNPKSVLRRAPSSLDNENPFVGNRRQLVVLASFQDQDFAEDHDATKLKWDKIFNTEDYTDDMYAGSVHDYFMAQSYGKFNLTFNLFFVELPDVRHKYRSTDVDDEYSQYMVDDIMDVLQTQDIDWSLYDWDGDAFVDQLLIVYAGEGMNDGGGEDSIWPHQWYLTWHLNLETEAPNDYRSYRTVMHGDKEYYVNNYCCVQEHGTCSTFGTICHEYSHCFGFPDFYYGVTSVNGEWEVMDYGNYNGRGFRPCNYSAHERMLMGWLTPVELSSPTTITDMPALVDEPVAYLIRNDGSENEYYFVENRQQRGWDKDLPGSGIIVFHIDYDKAIWTEAIDYTNSDTKKRYHIFPANNNFDHEGYSGWGYPYITTDDLGNTSVVNDCLTNTSAPAATLNNPNIDGELLMSKPITQMSVDANGLASFVFMDDKTTSVHGVLNDQEQVHTEAGPVYDLQGRHLPVPTKGLYIQGNKLRIKK